MGEPEVDRGSAATVWLLICVMGILLLLAAALVYLSVKARAKVRDLQAQLEADGGTLGDSRGRSSSAHTEARYMASLQKDDFLFLMRDIG